jgi:predicted transcriptional regulator
MNSLRWQLEVIETARLQEKDTACVVQSKLECELMDLKERLQQMESREKDWGQTESSLKKELQTNAGKSRELRRERAVLTEWCRQMERAVQQQMKAVNTQCDLRIERLKDIPRREIKLVRIQPE